MLRASKVSLFAFFTTVALLLALTVVGCSEPKSPSSEKKSEKSPITAQSPEAKPAKAEDEGHGHISGTHGGTVVSLGRDSYHVEIIVEKNGELRLYTLGNDETRVLAILSQDLLAYIKPQGETDSTSIEVKPKPQPGDEEGKASLFVGQLPKEAIGKSVEITIPSINIGGERFRANFHNEAVAHSEEQMPAAATDDTARALYLTPGGAYTAEDIKANGGVTSGEKFKGFRATHDLSPKPGDKICPVTLTKANPKCTWVIGGKTYEFCCPPCVDEFVALSKSNPSAIKDPGEYVKASGASEPEKK